MRILPEETGAVVIDMQEKLMMAMNETKACEEKAAMLLKGLQVLSIPTVIVQQYTIVAQLSRQKSKIFIMN